MIGLKKHRGLKRYYKNLVVKNDYGRIATLLDFDHPETWQEGWHLHFDSWGYGNNNFKRRKPHLDKLFRHFDLLIEKTSNVKADFQLYAILLDYDSHSDALFLNTINPDTSMRAFDLADLQATSTLTNRSLIDYIKTLTGYEKRYHAGYQEAFCLLFRKDVGVPFE